MFNVHILFLHFMPHNNKEDKVKSTGLLLRHSLKKKNPTRLEALCMNSFLTLNPKQSLSDTPLPRCVSLAVRGKDEKNREKSQLFLAQHCKAPLTLRTK